jgi:DNA-binding transcriptional ArsR family regulator
MAMEAVFRALADPARRQLLTRLYHQNGQTLNQLCHGAPMTRQAVTKHLTALKKANLVIPLWRGRSKHHYLNPTPLCQVADEWLQPFESVRIRALAELRRALEEHRPQ